MFLFDPPNDGGDDNKEDDDDYYPEPPEGASSKWFSRVKLAIRFIVFPNFVHLLLVVTTVVNMVGNSIQIVTGLRLTWSIKNLAYRLPTVKNQS